MKATNKALFLFLSIIVLGNTIAVAQTTTTVARKPIVTFIELGSVNCIPCKAMQPIMEEVRSKYPDQVNVVFHDVWTPKGQPYGQFFKIKVIPTQVFLDKNGKEYFRHEGFFPADELYKILAKGGVKL
ncbi:MAG: thioredoxin family protein [Spirochaetes bacterium]|nr:thioredoxin family protein [Spirochaetota bacterium]